MKKNLFSNNKSMSFKDLVKQNKEDLLHDKKEMDRIDRQLDEKYDRFHRKSVVKGGK
ncbi:FbpB family small basic protein [Alkalihalobacillus sp. R86527]|uniref:FbpB family small basic protein n=1 Tax=Alkalihalobacillus sp. R86527 TaxID=3093863 RepID=UPI003671A0F0